MATEVFTEVRQANNLMEELPAGAEFQDDIIILARLGKLNQFDDVRVIDLAHNLYFFQDVGSLYKRSVIIPCSRKAFWRAKLEQRKLMRRGSMAGY